MAQKHGEMDITEQQKTFAGFIRWGIYSTVAVVVALVFLAIVGT